MRDRIAEGQLRRELDLVLLRLERCGRAASIETGSENDRLAGDMFPDAQVVAAQVLGELSYGRLAQRAKVLANALERVCATEVTGAARSVAAPSPWRGVERYLASRRACSARSWRRASVPAPRRRSG